MCLSAGIQRQENLLDDFGRYVAWTAAQVTVVRDVPKSPLL